MKLSNEDQKRLLRAIRLTYRIRANFIHENRMILETRPKLGGHAFRKRRSFHEN